MTVLRAIAWAILVWIAWNADWPELLDCGPRKRKETES